MSESVVAVGRFGRLQVPVRVDEQGRLVLSPESGYAKILAQSAVAVSGAADTNENTLATIPVPAGAIGPNGSVRGRVNVGALTSSANNKTLRIRWGGASGTVIASIVHTTNTSAFFDFTISNRNSASSQSAYSFGNRGIDGVLTIATQATDTLDTTGALTIVVTCQKASSGETITMSSYLVELLYGA